MRKIFILLIFGFLVVSLLVSCAPQKDSTTNLLTASTSVTNTPDKQVTTARQKIVDAMHSLQEEHMYINSSIKDSARLDGWFDVNEYFTVLTHLSMQPGYTLDYVYHNNGSSGQPYLYARQIDSKPFNTLDELSQTDYLAYIKTDGTEESFFQYIVLRTMGGQFYLWWHAYYNDHTIICDQAGLETILSATSFVGITIPPDIHNEARKLELAPVVELTNNTAIIRVVIFTKWGGFIEETYTIDKFNHDIKDFRTNTLLKWNSGITY